MIDRGDVTKSRSLYSMSEEKQSQGYSPLPKSTTGNPRYLGSAYSSMSVSSRTTVKSQSTQVRNTNRFPVKALTWLACGVQSGADIRKTTTTTIIPAGRRSAHKEGPAQLYSSEITYKWVARKNEDENVVPHWPPHVLSGSRQGHGNAGGGMPASRPRRSAHGRSPSIKPHRTRQRPQLPAQSRPPPPPAHGIPLKPSAQSRYSQGPAQRRPVPPIQGRPPPPPAYGIPPPPPPP